MSILKEWDEFHGTENTSGSVSNESDDRSHEKHKKWINKYSQILSVCLSVCLVPIQQSIHQFTDTPTVYTTHINLHPISICRGRLSHRGGQPETHLKGPFLFSS